MLGNIYRLTLEAKSSVTGTPINNVLWFRELVSHADTGAGDLAADFIAHINTDPIREWQHPNFRWSSLRAQRMWPVIDPPEEVFYVPTVGGLCTTYPLPSICAMVARLSTTLAGRNFNGRLYLGGFGYHKGGNTNLPIMTDDGHWNATATAEIANWLLTIQARYQAGAGDWSWHIHSRKLSTPFNPLVTPPAPPIVSIDVDHVVRLQRSREFGVSRRHAGRH